MASDFTSDSELASSGGASPSEGESYRSRYRYLPHLTVALLLMMGAWFLQHYVLQRPSDAHKTRMESFGRALELIRENYAGDISEQDLYEAAMQGMVTRLQGRYSTYLTNTEMGQARVETRGSFGGIGAVLAKENGALVITEVQDDGPAAKAGLERDDVIVKVDDTVVGNLPLMQAVAMIRGEKGTNVALTVRKAGSGQVRRFEITREEISFNTVEGRVLGEDIALLEVRRFDEGASERLIEKVNELKKKGVGSMILDLRDNPGGLLSEAVLTADAFLDSGVIVTVNRDDHEETISAEKGTTVPKDWPVVVLVNGRTASAAEIVAGVLKENDRATVMGTPTLGKGAVNRMFDLPDGSGIMLTVAHYLVAGKVKVSGNGIEPDIVVGEVSFPDGAGFGERRRLLMEAREKQMERARRFLEEKSGE